MTQTYRNCIVTGNKQIIKNCAAMNCSAFVKFQISRAIYGGNYMQWNDIYYLYNLDKLWLAHIYAYFSYSKCDMIHTWIRTFRVYTEKPQTWSKLFSSNITTPVIKNYISDLVMLDVNCNLVTGSLLVACNALLGTYNLGRRLPYH